MENPPCRRALREWDFYHFFLDLGAQMSMQLKVSESLWERDPCFVDLCSLCPPLDFQR